MNYSPLERFTIFMGGRAGEAGLFFCLPNLKILANITLS
jgi:hypothetical protein